MDCFPMRLSLGYFYNMFEIRDYFELLIVRTLDIT